MLTVLFAGSLITCCDGDILSVPSSSNGETGQSSVAHVSLLPVAGCATLTIRSQSQFSTPHVVEVLGPGSPEVILLPPGTTVRVAIPSSSCSSSSPGFSSSCAPTTGGGGDKEQLMVETALEILSQGTGAMRLSDLVMSLEIEWAQRFNNNATFSKKFTEEFVARLLKERAATAAHTFVNETTGETHVVRHKPQEALPAAVGEEVGVLMEEVMVSKKQRAPGEAALTFEDLAKLTSPSQAQKESSGGGGGFLSSVMPPWLAWRKTAVSFSMLMRQLKKRSDLFSWATNRGETTVFLKPPAPAAAAAAKE